MAHVGVCVDGPMSGQEARSRKPKGFILVNREMARVWIYDWSEQLKQFLCRFPDGAPEVADKEAPKNRYRAAAEAEFDVLADPRQGTGEDTHGNQA